MFSRALTRIVSFFDRLLCPSKRLGSIDSREEVTCEKTCRDPCVPVFSGDRVVETPFQTTVDFQNDPLWSTKHEDQTQSSTDHVSQHYARARDIARKSNMAASDIEQMTSTFWNFHLHNLVTVDPATTIILTIHYNLGMGTIIPFSHCRPDLKTLVDKLAVFDLCGSFMLTEIGHGLDARNLETTATLQPDGSFVLHTPTEAAAKAMPPTSPKAGISRIAVVFARLIAGEKDRGIKAFVVQLSNEQEMCPGIKSQILPFRPGSRGLDHSITTFTYVRLEYSALLGTTTTATNPGKDFFKQIHRVAVGGLSLSICNVPVLGHACYTIAKYSMRRCVQSPMGVVPIVSFRTQHRPILLGFAQAAVFEQYAAWVIRHFMEMPSDQMKHGMVTVYKAVVARDSQATLSELVDRCGWQGLYNHNGIIEYMLAMRGNSIAEGDVLVLCLKVASELLRDKYRLPQAKYPNSMLARHENGLFGELKGRMRSMMFQSKRRQYEQYNAEILPRCRAMIESIGQRMAYEAALDSGKVSDELLRLYESHCVMTYDSSWYIENMRMTREKIHKDDAAATDKALPLLKGIVEGANYDGYVKAPILDEAQWHNFRNMLPSFEHGAVE